MASIIKRPGVGGKVAYRAEVRRKGFPNQVKTFNRRGDAVKWARKIEREMDEGFWAGAPGAESILISNALDRYLAEVSTKKRPRTRERDELSARHLKKRLGKLSLTKVTAARVASYRDARLKEVSPHSVRLELALLSHMYNTARKEWNLERLPNPVRDVKKPQVPEGRCPILSGEQLERLLFECRQSRTRLLYPFVLLALHTGCRSSEVRGLKWSQVDLKKGFISLIGEEVKNHRRRNVPLTRPALEELSRLASEAKLVDLHGSPTGLVFPSVGNPAKPRDMHMSFDRAVKRAGLDDLPGSGKLRIHDLRHCCGSALIMSGVDLETTRKLLGHRDISTTQKYLHVVDDHARRAVDKIGVLGISLESGSLGGE